MAMIYNKELNRLRDWEVSFEKDAVFLEQNTVAENLFILLEGRVDVFVHGEWVAEVSGKGSYIGELAFLLEEPVTATCRAQMPVKLIKVPSERLEEFLKSTNPVIIYRLARQIIKRIQHIDSRLADINQQINPKDLNKLKVYKISKYHGREWLANEEESSKYNLELAAGEFLVTENSPAKDLFLLKEGELIVSKRGREINRISEPGSSIGEIGFILDQSHTASCMASKHSKVIRLSKSAFEERIQTSKAFTQLFLSNIAKRLVTMSNELGTKLLDYRYGDISEDA